MSEFHHVYTYEYTLIQSVNWLVFNKQNISYTVTVRCVNITSCWKINLYWINKEWGLGLHISKYHCMPLIWTTLRVVLYFIIFIYDNIYHIILLWVLVIVQKDQKPKWPSNLINMYSEETRSLSDVTYMVKESLAGSTTGIKTVQAVFSVNYRNTHSVLLLSLTQVNTPVMEKRAEDHEHQTSVMQLHWQYQVSLIISFYTVCKNVYDSLISDPRTVSKCSDL